MNSAVLTEEFTDGKKKEYAHFVENLGTHVRFSENKWICDKLRRSPAEGTHSFALYFTKIPEQYREIVKYFSAIRIINGIVIGTVMVDVTNLNKFLDFLTVNYNAVGLNMCDESVAAMFYQYLEESRLAETTKGRIWTSVITLFKTMNGWNDEYFKNPFLISPYSPQRKFDDMYIPENVALQLDNIFKMDEIALHLR